MGILLNAAQAIDVDLTAIERQPKDWRDAVGQPLAAALRDEREAYREEGGREPSRVGDLDGDLAWLASVSEAVGVSLTTIRCRVGHHVIHDGVDTRDIGHRDGTTYANRSCKC